MLLYRAQKTQPCAAHLTDALQKFGYLRAYDGPPLRDLLAMTAIVERDIRATTDTFDPIMFLGPKSQRQQPRTLRLLNLGHSPSNPKGPPMTHTCLTAPTAHPEVDKQRSTIARNMDQRLRRINRIRTRRILNEHRRLAIALAMPYEAIVLADRSRINRPTRHPKQSLWINEAARHRCHLCRRYQVVALRA